MNFFEQQAQARSRSRWLLLMFVLAVLAVIIAMDALLLFALGMTSWQTEGVAPFSAEGLRQNGPLLLGGGVVCAAVIGLAVLTTGIGLWPEFLLRYALLAARGLGGHTP